MKFQTIDQAIEKFNMAGRIIKISHIPSLALDLYFIVQTKKLFNLSKVVVIAEVVSILTGKTTMLEIDNGFALTLFSERK